MNPKPAADLTDEELFDAIREQVNLSRNTLTIRGPGHNRSCTRELAAEAQKRGWNLRRPSEEISPLTARGR